MKNKNLIISFAILAIILVGAGVLLLSSNKKEEITPAEQIPLEEQITVIKPEDIGLTLSLSKDETRVTFEVTNTEGISGLDYELSYTAKGDIPRGIIGHIDVSPGKKVMQEIKLGTCSDSCHYDEDVSDIKLILKVAKTDGSTASVQKSLEQ